MFRLRKSKVRRSTAVLNTFLSETMPASVTVNCLSQAMRHHALYPSTKAAFRKSPEAVTCSLCLRHLLQERNLVGSVRLLAALRATQACGGLHYFPAVPDRNRFQLSRGKGGR